MVIVEGSRLTGVPCVQASDEAEAQAAYMARKGFVDAVYTMGYDAFLFGSPLVVRRVGVDAAAGASLEDLLNRIGLTLPQLVDAAVLAGTDFNKGVRGVGMRATVSPVRRYGCLEAVLEALN
nr:flap structure-specific endonuclease [Candidatus Bathyarchaeota archaeon]